MERKKSIYEQHFDDNNVGNDRGSPWKCNKHTRS